MGQLLDSAPGRWLDRHEYQYEFVKFNNINHLKSDLNIAC